MRTTEIHLEGTDDRFAVLRRKRGSAEIEIEILAPRGSTSLRVPAADPAAIWAMAQRLHRAIDTGSGGSLAARAYLVPLETLAEQ